MNEPKNQKPTDANLAKTMPKSLEAEQSLLGCILVDPEIALELAIFLNENYFFYQQNRLVAEAMFSICAANKPVDIVTLTDSLERQNKLESVGGVNYLSTLAQNVPSSANYKHYLEIVRRCATSRALIRSCTEIIENCYTSEDRAETVASAEEKIYKVGQSDLTGGLEHLREAAMTLLARMEEKAQNRNRFSGVPTGFIGLDQKINGFQKGNLVVLAALTGVGKSSMALNMALHAAQKSKTVAIFSLEMPKEEIAQRLLCTASDTGMTQVSSVKLIDKDWARLWETNEMFSGLEIYIDDSSMNTPAQILSKCRRLKSKHGLDFVIIDYLQLMSAGESGKKRYESRQQEISELTRSLKIYAKELDVPILALSQLSREAAKRSVKDNKEPVLSDLRESGAIEQDADMVMFLYKPYEEVQNDAEISDIDLIIAKNRNGPLGRLNLTWQGDKVRFLEKTAPEISAKFSSAENHKITEGLKKLFEENHAAKDELVPPPEADAPAPPPDGE